VSVRLRATRLAELETLYGGKVHGQPEGEVRRLVPVEQAEAGDLAPLLSRRFVRAALAAHERRAVLLIDAKLTELADVADLPGWVHPHAAWAMSLVLERLAADPPRQDIDSTALIGEHVVLGPRVVVGKRVRIGPGSVVGAAGFGWAEGPPGEGVRRIPHLGGVVIEEDVEIGPLCTIDSGVLAPTFVRRGAKLDAHVHVGHNCDVGEGAMIAAQAGLAGSVTLGRWVQVGGQAGIADHVRVGDRARIAAKAGVIGDVPTGGTVAGYPAVPRIQWLRSVARMMRGPERK
jgi:UDP-3-O-[3-hydroxymyristoyl] glucosamine N-acyltransferase